MLIGKTDRFKKEDLVKNTSFFRKSVKLKIFFLQFKIFFPIRAYKGAVPYFSSTFL